MLNVFSALVTRYYDRSGVILASHKSKIVLAMKGTTAPFKTPKQKGAHPPSGNHLMYLLVEGTAPKKWSLFYQYFSTENVRLGPKQDIALLFEA
jgi:hypothetical protein